MSEWQGHLLSCLWTAKNKMCSLQYWVNPSVGSSKTSAQPPGFHPPLQVLLYYTKIRGKGETLLISNPQISNGTKTMFRGWPFDYCHYNNHKENLSLSIHIGRNPKIWRKKFAAAPAAEQENTTRAVVVAKNGEERWREDDVMMIVDGDVASSDKVLVGVALWRNIPGRLGYWGRGIRASVPFPNPPAWTWWHRWCSSSPISTDLHFNILCWVS